MLKSVRQFIASKMPLTLGSGNFAGASENINPLAHIETQLRLALVEYTRLQPYKAIDRLLKCATFAQTHELKSLQASILRQVGTYAIIIGENERAKEALEKALSISRELNDTLLECESLDGLGNALIGLGDHANGLDHILQALTIWENVPHSVASETLHVTILHDLGVAYAEKGNLKLGSDYLEQALAMSRQMQNKQLELESLHSAGTVRALMGYSASSIEMHKSGLKLADEIKDRYTRAQIQRNLGATYAQQGQTSEALKHMEDAHNFYDRIGAKKLRDDTERNLLTLIMEFDR